VLKTIAAVIVCGLLVPDSALAQTHAGRPVRLLVASAAGGGTDFIARATSTRLSEAIGNQIVIDNRGGVGGMLAGEIVARATADGHTLLLTSSNFVVLPSLHHKLPFDVVKDFAPVANVALTPWVLVVNPSLPPANVQQLIEYARSRAGALNYSTSGIGSFPHLAAELFKSVTKVQMEHVAYKGGGPAILAVLGNEVQLYFSTIPAGINQIRAGRLRPLAVTSAKRITALPQVPTLTEQGVNLEITGWFGMFAPAATPRAVVAALNASTNKVIEQPDTRERLMTEGTEPVPETPGAFGERVKADLRKWNTAITQAGIPPQ